MPYCQRETEVIRDCVLELLICLPTYEGDFFHILSIIDQHQEGDAEQSKPN
ncbi:MAG TPA: hypothetical protein PKO06_17405 [Candidatus Ozemobacteraceae bacterium]|nr:hypothetical protein [Candidatus Ozemobacteraceae bacterium]